MLPEKQEKKKERVLLKNRMPAQIKKQ